MRKVVKFLPILLALLLLLGTTTVALAQAATATPVGGQLPQTGGAPTPWAGMLLMVGGLIAVTGVVLALSKR